MKNQLGVTKDLFSLIVAIFIFIIYPVLLISLSVKTIENKVYIENLESQMMLMAEKLQDMPK